MAKPAKPSVMRPDIQALRALAVLSVIVFHFWPSALPGGFVGVDIFFVISGYLITGQLWRQVVRDGRVNFTDFWARRARRLLPASLLVILATMATSYFWMPKEQLQKFAGDAIGAAFYVANWQLIAKSTNYLEDTASPSPFQHFWSLSVEEQYYIVWPLVLFAALLLAKLLRQKARHAVIGILAIVVIGGLAYSIRLTTTQPAQAYFSTFTRSWEFALGALIAVALSREALKKISPVFYWVGAALLAYSLATFSSLTPFPSYWAALPVLGTAILLALGDQQSKLIPTRFLSLRPIQFVGDISYSLYLWHWPVLILTPWIVPGPWSLPRAFAVLGISFVLAYLSKTFVEDPVRFGRLAKASPIWQITLTSALVVVVAGSSLALSQAKPALANVANGPNQIFKVESPKSSSLPSNCLVTKTRQNFTHCLAGVKNASTRVAVLGDSHTRQYWSVLQDMALRRNWQLTLISKSACPLQDANTYSVSATDPSCRVWNTKLFDYLQKTPPFDLVINSNASFYTQGNAAVSASYRKFVANQVARGQDWVLIKDNPKPMKDIAACLVSAKGSAPEACAVSRSEALNPKDDLPQAIQGLPRTLVIDLTDEFCTDICKPVIDGKLQYRDFSHISWRASQRVAPIIEKAITTKFGF